MRKPRRPLFVPCVPPPEPHPDPVAAARAAVEHNPANAPPRAAAAALHAAGIDSPQFIAVMTSKYWGAGGVKLGVSFLDGPTAACRRLILEHMNAWGERCNVRFAESASGGQVRIARGNTGYWSYLGTDVLGIPAGQPTMNLQGFTENTPLSEYKRVVRHETGHTLGCPHEHMRRAIVDLLDAAKTIAYFRQTQGWSQQTVIQQVLTPVEEASLMAVPGGPVIDDESIMCYQLPGSITKSGKPIPGGVDILDSDFAYMARLYPKAAVPPPAPPPPSPPPPPAAGRLVVDLDGRAVTLPAGWTVAK